jgi:hydroxyethylthiazole kinase
MSKLDAYKLLEKVREQKPVVHHLTNWVTIYDCANIVKTFGASPVMAHAKEEAADMAQIASSLVLNIGTLTPELVEAMKIAALAANKKGIPVILDVCGAGATPLRDQKSLELISETKIDIIKGNASEIARIAGEDVKTRGVDAGDVKKTIASTAQKLAQRHRCTVVVTGKNDIVTDGKKTYIIKNGDEMMTHVVGTGCMAASVIGTFCAVEKDLVCAAVCALSCFGIAAEEAAKISSGPATFKEKLFDCVFHLDEKTIQKMQNVI